MNPEEHACQEIDRLLAAAGWAVQGVKSGKRIRDEALRHKLADYGERVVASLSRQLAAEYGRGFEEKNLRRMVQFAEAFPDEAIVATLWRQLSWSHFRESLPPKQLLQRRSAGAASRRGFR